MTPEIVLDKNNRIPLHRQIYHEIQRLILSEIWRAGRRLPSTRDMAKQLQISRATVCMAYEQLLADGYLQSFTGSGTYVSREIHDRRFIKKQEVPTTSHPEQTSPEEMFSTFGNFLTSFDNFSPHSDLTELNMFGNPCRDSAFQAWQRVLRRRLSEVGSENITSEPAGLMPLRQTISEQLLRTRGVRCQAEQVIVTSSRRQALALIAHLHVESGDQIVVENPGDPSVRDLFLAHGADVTGASVDYAGLIFDRSAQDTDVAPKIIYVRPSCQIPTGSVMSRFCRQELVKWAVENRTMIIEDDCGIESSLAGQSLRSLQGIDSANLVLYVGSFENILSPCSRISFIVVPPAFVRVYHKAASTAGCFISRAEQYALVDLLTHGTLEKLARSARVASDQKRAILTECFRLLFGDTVQCGGSTLGACIMIGMPHNMGESNLAELRAIPGVSVTSTTPYYQNGGAPTGQYVVNYAGACETDLVGFLNGMNEREANARSVETIAAVPVPVTQIGQTAIAWNAG
ncbi:MAG TPA: PLP-dependent aminotransferase family protein [Candidatus Obscuribacterales bacterium]